MKISKNLKGIFKNSIVYIGLFLICIIFAILNPTFISFSNLMTILSHMAPLALMSFGLATVMVDGDFDLSIVGITGFSAVTLIMLSNQFNLFVGLLGGLIVAALVGFLEWVLCGQDWYSSLASDDCYDEDDLWPRTDTIKRLCPELKSSVHLLAGPL